MQTWTVVRFLHLLGIVFFVGGQLVLVTAITPTVDRRAGKDTVRVIANRFAIGSVLALAVAVATGVALASHYSLWSSDTLQLKLMLLVLVGVLSVLQVISPDSRVVGYGVAVSSLLVLWLGVKLTYG